MLARLRCDQGDSCRSLESTYLPRLYGQADLQSLEVILQGAAHLPAESSAARAYVVQDPVRQQIIDTVREMAAIPRGCRVCIYPPT